MPLAATFEETLLRELAAAAEPDQPDPPPRNSNVIVISGLTAEATVTDLTRLFAHQEPQLVSIDLVKDPQTGRNAGYANIVLESPEAAEQAIDVLGGEGARVLVGNHGTGVVRFSQTASPNDLDEYHLYVGFLGSTAGVTEKRVIQYLTDLWERFAPPSDEDDDQRRRRDCPEVLKLGPLAVRLPRDPITRNPMPFCFVKFDFPNVPEVLLQLYEQKIEDGTMPKFLDDKVPVMRKLKRRPPMTIEGEQPLTKQEAPMWSNTTICAMGLPDDVSEKDLRKHFGPFGEITSVKVAIMKHLALIRFRQNVCALAAMTQLEGEPFRDRIIRLFWARSKNPLVAKDPTQAMQEAERASADKAEAEQWAQALKPTPPVAKKARTETKLSPEERARWAAELAASLGGGSGRPEAPLPPPPPPPPPRV